jgi:D-alanyl-D-alanine carboxypeptidase/D-alanyl-D-alanine-endopeptidase (penicillin-binding protein 4)
VSFERRADGAIEITGKLPVGGSRSETLAVDSPALFLGAAIRSELEKAGVRLAGTVRLVGDGEKLREGAMEVFVWKSRLVDAVAVANRRSQNFYAEQILKTLGAARSGQGSFQNGAAAVLDFAKAAHLPESTVSVTDGCGLGPDNKATPQAIAALLEVVYRSRIQGAFYNSLAVNGEAETTLRNRMGESGMRGRIHAKTGTIKSGGISALSGYATALDGEAYSFSVLCNGFNPGGLCQARELEDAVCYAIVGEKPAPRTK